MSVKQNERLARASIESRTIIPKLSLFEQVGRICRYQLHSPSLVGSVRSVLQEKSSSKVRISGGATPNDLIAI